MRDVLKSAGRWLRFGWILPLALLTLPMCGLPEVDCEIFDCDESDDPPPFEPGPNPTGAIMCDIPVFIGEGSDCASDTEIAMGLPRARAAVQLNLGAIANFIALDYSPDATSACSDGRPKMTQYFGPWPDGFTLCVDCGQQIPTVYADATTACIAKCNEMNTTAGQPEDEVDAFCASNARVATNFPKDGCFEDFCTTGGSPINPPDPRRQPEQVIWTDFENTTVSGTVLSFPGPDPMTGLFFAGAASEQLITTGDAWVEFEAGETGVSHVIGVRPSCDDITLCRDDDGTVGDLPLVLSLNFNGEINVVENGDTVLAGPFTPPFEAGERFRIYITDRNDGSADISFTRLDGQCDPEMTCVETPLYTYGGTAHPNYPLRVDVSFREPNASLNNVTLMRIIK